MNSLLRLLPDSVVSMWKGTYCRRDCDSNVGPSALESSTLTTQLPSHPRPTVLFRNLHNGVIWKFYKLLWSRRRQLLGLCPQTPTGASPLDPIGGLQSPDRKICPPPWKNSWLRHWVVLLASRVYVTRRCLSVHLSVLVWAHSRKPTAGGFLLWAWRAADIDREVLLQLCEYWVIVFSEICCCCWSA